jgi:putative flavoprotein involved in K+ transport
VKRISTVIIGAGHAGLAMSRCLSDRSVPHVVIERGEVANSWRTERWDSLRLLTPNWQSRLPGLAYAGRDPDGFMTMPQIVRHLTDYATISAAPVETRTNVLRVSGENQGYRVATDRGDWLCSNVVIASGACNRACIPDFAAGFPTGIQQIDPLAYRRPDQLRAGGVLVVGASATGVQLAAEIRASGRDVMLAAGQHIRMPRSYRGRDIQWWMDRSGVLDTTLDEVDDIDRARRVPSLQLVGSRSPRLMDLATLQAAGVEITGRLAGVRDDEALFSGSLANHCALSDLKMNRLLDGFDTWGEHRGITALPRPERFPPTPLSGAPRLRCNLADGRFRTVIWATGFRPDFGWLDLPVFDRKHRLNHDGGLVAPGLYVLGLPFLRRRKSALIDGAGDDARTLADHITQVRSRQAA